MKHKDLAILACPLCGSEQLLVVYDRGVLALFCANDYEEICAIEIDYEFEEVVDELRAESRDIARQNKKQKN